MNWHHREDSSGNMILYCTEYFDNGNKNPYEDLESHQIIWFVASHHPYLLASGDFPLASAEIPRHWIFI